MMAGDPPNWVSVRKPVEGGKATVIEARFAKWSLSRSVFLSNFLFLASNKKINGKVRTWSASRFVESISKNLSTNALQEQWAKENSFLHIDLDLIVCIFTARSCIVFKHGVQFYSPAGWGVLILCAAAGAVFPNHEGCWQEKVACIGTSPLVGKSTSLFFSKGLLWAAENQGYCGSIVKNTYINVIIHIWSQIQSLVAKECEIWIRSQNHEFASWVKPLKQGCWQSRKLLATHNNALHNLRRCN